MRRNPLVVNLTIELLWCSSLAERMSLIGIEGIARMLRSIGRSARIFSISNCKIPVGEVDWYKSYYCCIAPFGFIMIASGTHSMGVKRDR